MTRVHLNFSSFVLIMNFISIIGPKEIVLSAYNTELHRRCTRRCSTTNNRKDYETERSIDCFVSTEVARECRARRRGSIAESTVINHTMKNSQTDVRPQIWPTSYTITRYRDVEARCGAASSGYGEA